MDAVFLRLLNMSLAASWLVIVVILLRLLLRKAPKANRCVLWAFVGIRLLCPFSVESLWSFVPNTETFSLDLTQVDPPVIQSGITGLDDAVNPLLSKALAPSADTGIASVQTIARAATVVWLIGVLGMAMYAVVSYFRIRRKVAVSMPEKDNIWICDHLSTPFIFGIIRPRIFLPSAIGETEREYVLAHERVHLKRRDHWWKPLGFALLAVYWFNPLLWVAYILFCCDMELACDEQVIKDMGAADRKAYSAALLNCSVPRRTITACPLAFGETGVKGRIKSVLNYKKPAFWLGAVAVVACAAVAVCFLTSPATYDSACARVLYTYDGAFLGKAQNVKSFGGEDPHFPIYKFHSKAQLNRFLSEFEKELDPSLSWSGSPSLNSILEPYDTTFFLTNTLFLVYVTSGSGSYRYDVGDIHNDGTNFVVSIVRTDHADVGSCDMAGWIFAVTASNRVVKNCTTFDAVFDVSSLPNNH